MTFEMTTWAVSADYNAMNKLTRRELYPSGVFEIINMECNISPGSIYRPNQMNGDLHPMEEGSKTAPVSTRLCCAHASCRGIIRKV